MTTTNNKPTVEITEELLQQLDLEACEAGDMAMSRICRDAMDGDEDALRTVRKVLANARAQEGL